MSAPLALIPWTEVPDRPMVLVPLGSTEQHGPHLPFATDTMIADAVAHAVAERIRTSLTRPIVVAPALPFGASGEHQDFPGTISIGHDALRILLVELIRSLSTWASRIVLVNGHGGNALTVKAVINQMRDEQHDVRSISCALETTTDAHAGHDETSVMLHLAPDRVHMDSARPGNTQPLQELLPDLMRSGVRHVSPNGILGDPTTASVSTGGREFLALVDRVAAEVLHE
ncbi:MAG: mycofactocin biosynthesis peptidyl-dipeptidase MftE [Candidatus Nanopelagicales bacterium]